MKEEDSSYGLAVSYQEDIEELVSPVLEELSACKVKFNREPRPSTSYASFEWAIPTAVLLYLTKPFFDGFMSEAGKDTYGLLKSSIAKLFVTVSDNVVLLGGSTRKRQFSSKCSICYKTSSGVLLKFVFPEQASSEDIFVLSEAALQVCANIVEPVTAVPRQYGGEKNSIYMQWCADSESWIILDTDAEIRKIIEAKSKT